LQPEHKAAQAGNCIPDEQREDRLQARIAILEQELELTRTQAATLGLLLEKKLNEIYIQYHVSRITASHVKTREMTAEAFKIIKQAVPFHRLSVFLLDDTGKTLELIFSHGLDLPEKFTLPRGEGTPGRIVESGEHVHIHDLSLFHDTVDDFLHAPGEKKSYGSYIGAALKIRDKTIGVIGMDNPEKYSLSVDHMDFTAILSHQIAAGLEKAHLFETIEQLSQRDGLTGLYNHRVFQERLQQELARAERTGEPLSLIMLDIDHFKQFNDNFGHQAGDSVLRELSQLLMVQSRSDSMDTCCRYGGEEFAVIMPNLSPRRAVSVAERIRRTVEKKPFSIGAKAPGTSVTISMGVSGVENGATRTPEEVIKEADDALYLSKKEGRNRVTLGLPR
jgi:diguanylate cyclase (GGDEF)-like protein